MSSELEQRLQRALAQVEPNPAAGEQARAAALAALPRGGMRARHRLVVLLAAALAMLVLAAGALAASRSVREVVGLADRAPVPAHSPRPLPSGPLPAGSGGFAAFGSGRLWLASPGFRAAGRPFSAVELSPGALNIAVGEGHNLDVRRMTDGRLAWRHAAGGRLAGVAWAPIGTEIAYVVRHGNGNQLRVIEGDGDHDRLLALDVSPVAPSWRADSLAVAYVDSRGRPAVFDLAHVRTTTTPVRHSCAAMQTTQVEFAPSGGLLAASIGDGDMLMWNPASGWTRCREVALTRGSVPPAQFAWVGGHALISSSLQFLARMTVTGTRLIVAEPTPATAGINGLTVSPDHRQIAFGLWRDDGLHLVTARVPVDGARSLQLTGRLRTVPSPAARYALIWR
jgi:hypothetical protein